MAGSHVTIETGLIRRFVQIVPKRGIDENQHFTRIGSAQGTRGSKTPIFTLRRIILLLSVIGLLLTLLSFTSDWVFALLGGLGVDSRTNQVNVLQVLQIPALFFFVFLTIYAIKSTIGEYRRSFDQPRTHRPGSVNRGSSARSSRKKPSPKR